MICQIIIEITLSESNIDEIIISETLCKPLLFTSISNLLTFPLTSLIYHLQSIAELVDSSIPSVCHDQPLPCSDLTSGDCLQRKEVEAMMVRSHQLICSRILCHCLATWRTGGSRPLLLRAVQRVGRRKDSLNLISVSVSQGGALPFYLICYFRPLEFSVDRF